MKDVSKSRLNKISKNNLDDGFGMFWVEDWKSESQ